MLPGHWLQGELDDEKGNRCGLGWLCEAYGLKRSNVGQGGPLYTADIELMNIAAEDKFPDRIVDDQMVPFATFNDHPRTTESDVVAVMDLAADRWDVEHG